MTQTKKQNFANESTDPQVRVEILERGQWKAQAGELALFGTQMFGQDVVDHRELSKVLRHASDHKTGQLIESLRRIGILNDSDLMTVEVGRDSGYGKKKKVYYLTRMACWLVASRSNTKNARKLTRFMVAVFDAVIFGDAETRKELERALLTMQELRARDQIAAQAYADTVAALTADLERTRVELESARAGTGVIGIAKARRLLAQIRNLALLGVKDGKRKAIEIEVAKSCGHPMGRAWSCLLETQLGLATQCIEELLKTAVKPKYESGTSTQMPFNFGSN